MDIWVLHKEKKKKIKKNKVNWQGGGRAERGRRTGETFCFIVIFLSLFFFLDSQKFDRQNSSG